MKTRELDGRWEQNNVEGQYKSHQGLRPRSRVPGGLGCHVGLGRDLFPSLACAAGWLSLMCERRKSRTRLYSFYFADFDSKIGLKASLPVVYSLIVSVRQYRNCKEPSRRSSSFQSINLKSKYLQVQSVGIMKGFLQRINKILT